MDCIQKKEFPCLGDLLTKSHISLRDAYEVSCPELDFLSETAQNFSHCLGSRMMGGGFGGCTINLVHSDAIEVFSEHIKNKYQEKFNINPVIDTYTLVDGASIYRYINYES